MTRNEIITLAKQIDRGAVWASNDADENCLLVLPAAAQTLIKRVPDAWEDPNEEPTAHTRVVFPSLRGDLIA